MNKLNILQRHLTVLRLVQPPFSYPSKASVLKRLQQEDLDSVSNRTFDRDIKEIHDFYGITISYCRRHRGYFLNQPADEDLSSFRQFFQLLERSERLAFLTNSSDALSASKYLLLEENQAQLGLQHLPLLWNALRTQRQLSFRYQTFQTDMPKSYQVDPLVLLEYRNRWYLAAWDEAGQRFKTFGLERMQAPQLNPLPVRKDRRAEFLALKRDALGVYFGHDQQVTHVLLQVDGTMAPYIRTVPLHHSQAIREEQEDCSLSISLRLVLNHELESMLLSYGEHVEVLEPQALRERMRERIQQLARRYTSEIILEKSSTPP